MEAGVTAQADDVLGSDLFDLLLPYTRPDPFEPCFRSALSACAHGSPSLYDSTGLVEEELDGFGRLRFLAFISRSQSIARPGENHGGSHRGGPPASRIGSLDRQKDRDGESPLNRTRGWAPLRQALSPCPAPSWGTSKRSRRR